MRPIFETWMAPLKDYGATTLTIRNTGSTDHMSFDGAGVPGFAVQQDMAEYRLTHHSQSDTLDKARPDDLVQGAQVMAVAAMSPAWDTHRPYVVVHVAMTGALAVAGIAIGIVGAVAVTRYLTTLLFGVKPVDAITFVGVGLVYKEIERLPQRLTGQILIAGVLTTMSRPGSAHEHTLAHCGRALDRFDRKFGGDASFKDLAADGAGILAATVLLRHTER